MKHIVEVLHTASSLIRDEAWSVLTASDAAMLCFASLVHDSAMHLTEDGFLSLVHDASSPTALPGDQPWPDIWAGFLSEAASLGDRMK